MASNDSSVPLRDELEALATFIGEEFRGTSNLAVPSFLKERVIVYFK